MSAVLDTGLGKVTYGNDFIASIAGLTATECAGVVGMASKSVGDGIGQLLKRDNIMKGVKVLTNESNVLVIELFMIVEFGVAIGTVGENVIENVKYAVERLTGLKVKEVNITISGIRV